MFNWTTTTILNSLKDITTGADLIKVWTGAEASGDVKAGFSGVYPVVKVKRDHLFETRYVTSAYKAVSADPVLCKISLDCDALITAIKALHTEATWKDHARLSLYIGLEGSEESIYANDMYKKGKPFSVGFDVTSATVAADLAALIKKNAEKYGVVIYGKQVLKLTVNGTKLVIEGTHEHQRVRNAFVAVDTVVDEEVVASYDEDEGTTDGTQSADKIFTLDKRGSNGFGTYTQLIKDLRLPTYANLQWNALHEDEKPVVGGHYNQYIISYCAPSMANPGLTMIGQHGNSVTTHVFWVNKSISDAFEAAMKGTGTGSDVGIVFTEVKTTGKESTEAGTNYAENHEQSETVSHKKTK